MQKKVPETGGWWQTCRLAYLILHVAETVMMLPSFRVSVPPASLNVFVLPLMANFHLPWAQGRGAGIPEVIPFLPQKQTTSFKGYFAALPSKVLNAPLFFSCSPACKVLPSLFCPHTQGATCKKLNSSNRKKKNQSCDLMNTGFFQKGQLVHSSSFTSHSCPLSHTSSSLLQLNRTRKIASFKNTLLFLVLVWFWRGLLCVLFCLFYP